MSQIFSWQSHLVEIDKRGVRKAFTPHKPISNIESLLGRQPELQRMLGCLDTPGRHVLLYGDRGVGKSSLVKVMPYLAASKWKERNFYHACDSSSTFETIAYGILNDLKVSDFNEHTISIEENIKAGASITFLNAETNKKKTSQTKHSSAVLSPAVVAKLLEGQKAALITIDEADTIQNPTEKGKLAELLKLLSDADSNLKLIIVGIADTASDLTNGHPSVQRCLEEVKLLRLKDEYIRELILTKMSALKFECEPAVATEVAKLANGFPYFAHLIGQNLAGLAVIDGRKFIRTSHMQAALSECTKSSEQSLNNAYQDAIRSPTTLSYKKVVIAAAHIIFPEFSRNHVKSKYKELHNHDLSDSSCSTTFMRLAGVNGGHILRRTGRGVYRFADPRMC